MCTAISQEKFAGRNLDIERGYGEKLIITPSKFLLPFRTIENIPVHFAFIGIGTEIEGYPLYFDAANEHGLYIAGLNYVGNAKYHSPRVSMINLAPYEIIPYILSKCRSVVEAMAEFKNINIVNIPFSEGIPVSELHYFIADKSSSITVEPDESGLSVYYNSVGVLTNNPPFPIQMHNLNNYAGLTCEPLTIRMSNKITFDMYSRGMGALGLPGDLSSQSRFVRAAFHKLNLMNSDTPCDIFHLLSSVEMPKGSLKLGDLYEYTAYSAVVDLEKCEYFFKTYNSLSVTRLALSSVDKHSNSLCCFPLGSSSGAASLIDQH